MAKSTGTDKGLVVGKHGGHAVNDDGTIFHDYKLTAGAAGEIQTGAPSTLSMGGTNQEGSSSSLARADHVHRLDITSEDLAGLLPDSLLGAVIFGGTFDASSGTVTLSSNAKQRLDTTSNTITLTVNAGGQGGYQAHEGLYYITQADAPGNGEGDWNAKTFRPGDWLISTGERWAKVANTDAISTVQVGTGSIMTGNVVITKAMLDNAIGIAGNIS